MLRRARSMLSESTMICTWIIPSANAVPSAISAFTATAPRIFPFGEYFLPSLDHSRRGIYDLALMVAARREADGRSRGVFCWDHVRAAFEILVCRSRIDSIQRELQQYRSQPF